MTLILYNLGLESQPIKADFLMPSNTQRRQNMRQRKPVERNTAGVHHSRHTITFLKLQSHSLSIYLPTSRNYPSLHTSLSPSTL